MDGQTVERLILVIENNSEHLNLIQTALNSGSVQHHIIAIANGMDALDFLHHRGQFVDAARPDLILLDLNLPDKDGRDILANLKNTPHLKRIPVIILSTSASEADIFNSYASQGNCYVIKSQDINQLAQIVKRLEEFWLGIVTLPLE